MAERIGDYARGGPAIHADDTPIPVQDSRTRAYQKRPVMGRYVRRRHLGLAQSAGGFLSLRLTARASTPKPCWRRHPASCTPTPMPASTNSTNRIRSPVARAVACWAHARRELFDEHAKTKSPIARQALGQIGAIFAVQRDHQRPERRSSSGRAPGSKRAVAGRTQATWRPVRVGSVAKETSPRPSATASTAGRRSAPSPKMAVSR